MTQWCDLDFAKGVKVRLSALSLNEENLSAALCQLKWLTGRQWHAQDVSWDPYLKFYYQIKKERLFCLDIIHHACPLIFTWETRIHASTEYTYLLLDERWASQWLWPFANASQKKMFLTSLWSPALGGYVCKYCINLRSVLAFFKVQLAKLVIPERGLFYGPFENGPLQVIQVRHPG